MLNTQALVTYDTTPLLVLSADEKQWRDSESESDGQHSTCSNNARSTYEGTSETLTPDSGAVRNGG